ncbi:MAG: type II toxin-antitoxin system RelE/ParE family toxin, partial [Elusimicrobiota bacterium]
MKKLPVVYLRRAQSDLIDAASYIARDSPAEARKWLEQIDASLGRLASFPRSGSPVKEPRLALLGYRVVVLGEYLAFYLLRRGRMEVRRVL